MTNYAERIKELNEDINRIWETECKSRLDRAHESGQWLEGAEKEAYERAEADMDSKIEQRDTLQRAWDREVRTANPAAPIGDSDTIPGGNVSQERYAKAFDAYLRTRGQMQMRHEDAMILQNGFVEDRALGEAVGAAGGYTVPEQFQNRIVETMKAFGGVIELANVITTSTGADIPWLGNDDTGNEGAILAENTQISEQDVTFTGNTLGAYTYTSKLVRVSWQLLQDAVIDVEAFLARKFGERLARIHNRHFTVGTGSGQPLGVATGATVGKTAASATAVTFDELIDLIHSIDPAYRNEGGPRFMFNDASLANIRKVKTGISGDVTYVWQPSMQAGVADTILGYPYSINQNMPTMATGNKSILFGNFGAYYVVRRVKGIQVVTLKERYADFLQNGYFAFDRMDGTTDDVNAVKALAQA